MLLELLKGLKADITDVRETVQHQGIILTRVEIGYEAHHNRSLHNEQVAKTAREDSLAARNDAKKMFDALQAEISPLKSHVAAWGGVAKAIAVIAAVGSVATAIFGAVKFFAH